MTWETICWWTSKMVEEYALHDRRATIEGE
jgi:hypothetical protein